MSKFKEVDFDKIFITDTSPLIDEPDLIFDLINGNNLVYIPWMTHRELTTAKKNISVSKRAKRALKNINEYTSRKHPLLKLMNVNWEGINGYKPAGILQKEIADDEIIATALGILKQSEARGKEVILLTHDIGMQIKAREMKVNGSDHLIVQEWNQDKGDTADQLEMKTITLEKSMIRSKEFKNGRIPISLIENGEEILENHGVLIKCVDEEESYISHVARRKEGSLILLPQECKLLSIGPKPIKPINGETVTNWAQILTINLFKDLDLGLFALIGAAGSGKTLLSLAMAIHFLLEKQFRNLYITRVPVPVGSRTLGYVPGNIEEKMDEWLQAIYDNLEIIIELNPTLEKKINFFMEGENVQGSQNIPKGASNREFNNNERRRRKRIKVLSYEHARGRTLENSIIIVDEAQNMPRDDMITFATRPGENTRMIFTGDPTQIDDEYLTEQRNGLVWFTKIMRGDPVFAHVYFPETVRSKVVMAVLNRLKNHS